MSKLFTVTKNELLRYFISPLAYVYLVTFLLLNSSFAIYFGAFFERGNADLSSMFAFQPWIYLIFIPGISMRLWSEEFRNKTIVQIMTMPIATSTLVWGKYLAALTFCALALALTFPFWITVNILGQPDNMVIAVSYFSSFILAGCMLSISQTMSALTKNQVIALVLSVFANLLFFLSGLEYVLGFFRVFAPISIVDMIASFSFLTHFETLSRGLLEARDIIFFASVIIFFNFITILIISFKTSGTAHWLKSTSRNYYLLAFSCLVLVFIGINLIANNQFRNLQHDFTEEKIYTLTDTTKDLLKNLPEPIVAKLYYSPILGERNPEIRRMFDKVRLLLQQYNKISNGKFSFRIYNPKVLDDAENKAIAAGLQPFPLVDLSQNGYFGISFNDAVDNKQNLPFFSLARENFIEQDLTQKIYQLSHRKKNLGIITGLPIFDTIVSDNMVTQKWEIIRQLEELYNLNIIDSAESFNDNLDVLMIVHPRNLSPELIDKIKDYSISGGKSLVLLDATPEAPRIFSPSNQEFYPSDLGGLEEFWNFHFYNNVVIADLDNSITVDATGNYKTNPSFTQDVIQFIAQDNSMNKTTPETAKLNRILFASASPIVNTNPEESEFTTLLEPSINSALMPIDVVYQGMNPADILKFFKPDTNPKTIAARIRSKNANRPYDIIVVGDTDFLYDSFWTTSETILDNNYFIPILDNGNFVFNALEVLTGGDNLINLRGKSAKARHFDDIERLRKTKQLEFKIQEDKIFEKINKTKNDLGQIWGKKEFEGRQNFTSDELAIISSIRKNLDNLRQELSNIRVNMNNEIDRIAKDVKFYNIYIIPGCLLLGLLLISLFKNRNNLRVNDKIKLNREIIKLIVGSLFILSLGIISVQQLEKNDIAEYEGKLVFENLAGKINDIDKISLQSYNQTLHFYKENDTWKLENDKQLPVYQERVKSFLSSLLYATYYEKKSDKAEHLSKFGLEPIEIKGSPNIRIELKDKNNKIIDSFEVGKFDIDIGRGGRAAYIKFDNQFQVWLINADFVDLSTNWQTWTYSTAWNLRFGRLESINDNTNIDDIANIAKVLLNTTITPSNKIDTSLELLESLNIKIENNNSALIDIYQSGENYYIDYQIQEPINGKHLQLFADYVRGNLYTIEKPNWELIKDVLTSFKQRTER